MKNSLERRKAKRLSFIYYMPVIDDDTGEMIGHLTEISAHGIRLDSPRVLPADQKINLRLELTGDIADRPFMVLTARPKWCREDKITPNVYNVGLEIVSIGPQEAEIFQRLAEKFASEKTR